MYFTPEDGFLIFRQKGNLSGQSSILVSTCYSPDSETWSGLLVPVLEAAPDKKTQPTNNGMMCNTEDLWPPTVVEIEHQINPPKNVFKLTIILII